MDGGLEPWQRGTGWLVGVRGVVVDPLEALANDLATYHAAPANAKPLTSVTTKKTAASTLVDCADTIAKAEAHGIWEAVDWWYVELAEFLLRWKLTDFPEEQKAASPVLKERSEGGFNPKPYQEADMTILGDPDHVVEQMIRYEQTGFDHLLCHTQFGHRSQAAQLLGAPRAVCDPRARTAREADPDRALRAVPRWLFCIPSRSEASTGIAMSKGRCHGTQRSVRATGRKVPHLGGDDALALNR